MKKFTAILCSAVMALTAAPLSMAPAKAAPIQPIKLEISHSGVEKVQHRRHRAHRHRAHRHHHRGHRRGFYRHGHHHYYHGHRGYRHYRPGYRYYNGWWFPMAAFTAGALIGGAIAAPPARAAGDAHVQWCYSRYRSYRAYDNTFQPYNGPRRQCVSPYR